MFNATMLKMMLGEDVFNDLQHQASVALGVVQEFNARATRIEHKLDALLDGLGITLDEPAQLEKQGAENHG